MAGLAAAAALSAAMSPETERIAHEQEWATVWNRSYVSVTSSNEATSAKQVTDHCNWDRFLNLAQGRSAFAPIKFNGQVCCIFAFTRTILPCADSGRIDAGLQLQQYWEGLGCTRLGCRLLVAEYATTGTFIHKNHTPPRCFRMPCRRLIECGRLWASHTPSAHGAVLQQSCGGRS
jgi:hypothetical protein